MRTKLALMIGIAGLAVAGWSAAAWAHHAFAAEFDANKPVNFKGASPRWSGSIPTLGCTST